MKELDLPALLKDRLEFYNKLWGMKVRGEDLSFFSHLVSSAFDRQIDIEPKSGDLQGGAPQESRKGKIIFTDKKNGFTFAADIQGSLQDLKRNVDTDKRNKEDSLFHFCTLSGEVHYETPFVIMKGYYRNGKTMGGFYQHQKSYKLPGEKGPKDGTIIQTIKQMYDAEGRRHGLWFVKTETRRESVQYQNGEKVAGSRTVKYFPRPKTRAHQLIDSLLSIGIIAHVARCFTRRIPENNPVTLKKNIHQGR